MCIKRYCYQYGIFFLLLLSGVAYGQQEVRGKIVDSQGSVPGVSVKLKNSAVTTISNADGVYVIQVSDSKKGILVFSSVGYKTKEISINGQSTVNVKMEEDISDLDEVVVVGYGTVKKVNLTGSVSSISGDDIAKRPVMRASAALQGLAAGVTVTQNSGQPGSDGGTIRIRGVGTLGNSSALVLVDGVEGSLDGVDPNDIENVSVLKDAASAAIYGSRAANGVILVTTKAAKAGAVKMDYNGFVGKQVFTATPEFTDGYTYLTAMNEAYNNVGTTPLYSDQYLSDYDRYKNIDPDRYPDTDWQNELYTGSGLAQRHYLGISGGNKVSVAGSFAYQDQQGIIPNFRSERYSLRLNAKMDIKDNLQSRVFLSGRHSPTMSPTTENNIKLAVNRTPPIYPARLLNGNWGVASNGNNPIAQASEGGTNDYLYNQLRATFQMNYQPFKGADVELSLSPEFNGSSRKAFNKSIQSYEPGIETPLYTVPVVSSLVRGDVRAIENTGRLLARYKKTIKQHDFALLGGYEQISYKTESFTARREGFPLVNYQQLDAGSVLNWSNSGTASDWALRSYFARINYAFQGKYLLEANVRADGSSRFPEGNKYGVFPSFSAGWRLSKENFMKDINWLSELKVRASYGTLGNQEIGNYPFSSVITLGPSYIFGNMPADGGNQKEAVNENISWESSETKDIGFDAAFFENRFSITADYYVRNTTGILLRLPVPSIIGLTEPYQNAGVVKNTGWELGLNYRNKKGAFNYQVGLNLSDVRNEVVDLKGAGPIISGYELIEEGYAINTLFGYQTLGLFQTSDQVSSYPQQIGVYGRGDIIYKDVKEDNVINASDRAPIGNQIPRYTFGLNFSAQYKAFDISLLVQGVGKKDVLFNEDAVWALYNNGKMQVWQLDNWTPDNPNAEYPRLIAGSSHNNFQNSSYWVYNAAYARLKNLQLGFTIPKKFTNKLSLDRMRVYATGDNVFTLDHMPKGWDPERPSGNASIYPIASTFLLGLDITF